MKAARERLAARFASTVSPPVVFHDLPAAAGVQPLSTAFTAVLILRAWPSFVRWPPFARCAAAGTPPGTVSHPNPYVPAFQAQVGGKGTVRRKHKAAHKATGADDKKLQATLKRLNVTALPVIEEVSFCTCCAHPWRAIAVAIRGSGAFSNLRANCVGPFFTGIRAILRRSICSRTMARLFTSRTRVVRARVAHVRIDFSVFVIVSCCLRFSRPCSPSIRAVQHVRCCWQRRDQE